MSLFVFQQSVSTSDMWLIHSIQVQGFQSLMFLRKNGLHMLAAPTLNGLNPTCISFCIDNNGNVTSFWLLLTLKRFKKLFWCFFCWLWTSIYRLALKKKINFSLRISSINLTKFRRNCGYSHVYRRNSSWKTWFLVQCGQQETKIHVATHKSLIIIFEDSFCQKYD